MSWASQFIKHNRGFIGNAMKNVSPFLALTPLGIPASLAAGALGRAIQPGAKLGDIARSGLSNGALGAGVQGGMGALRSMFSPSSSAAGAVYGSGPAGAEIGGESMGAGTLGGGSGPGGAFVSGAADGPGMAGQSLSARLGTALGKAGSFAEAHPKALEMGLGAFDSTNRDFTRAQTNHLTAMDQADAEERERRRKRDEALAPVWAAFMGQMGQMQSNPYPIANNPYGAGR